jgi:hypothetical protein
MSEPLLFQHHVHIHDSQRKKLDNKSKKCVLFGISDESKGYKLYHPVDKKIIIGRDVIFEESKTLEWNKNQKQNESKDKWSQVEHADDWS